MERRLVAILAADVVGYSALMEQDEQGTFELLKTRRKELFEPEIERHHGRIFKLMGDGLLAEFPSVVDAVECAVALQQGQAERNASSPRDKTFDVRIGVNLGEVIVEGDDRYGEGVNIATRLEQIAEPGSIYVSAKVAKEVEKTLPFGFEAMGEQKVKNLAELITVYRVRLDKKPFRLPDRLTRRWQLRRKMAVAVVALAVLATGAATVWETYLRSGSSFTASEPAVTGAAPLVAVMPFSNLSGDPGLDYFADGVTETLTAALSRLSDIRVIARTSSGVYKGKSVDIRQIGRELGAHYVLEGSVQKGKEKVRIIAQLIDARTGDHVWTERYDREGADALALQDEVTEQIAVSLAGGESLIKKREYERAWGKDHASLDEYDYYLRGEKLSYEYTKESTLQSIATFEEGLKKYPESGLLRSVLGWGYYQLVYGGWSSDVEGDYKRAFQYAEEALGSPNVPPIAQAGGHALMAYLQIEYKKDWDRALKEREVFVALQPNDQAYISMGAEIAIRAGRPDDAIAALTRDIPWDVNSLWNSPELRLGWGYFVKGDYKTALEHLKRERNSDPVWTLPFLAATYAELGLMTEARDAVKKIREANPAVSLALIGQVFSNRDQAVTDRLVGALRKAGLPENSPGL